MSEILYPHLPRNEGPVIFERRKRQHLQTVLSHYVHSFLHVVIVTIQLQAIYSLLDIFFNAGRQSMVWMNQKGSKV